jgi:hypothetical protein
MLNIKVLIPIPKAKSINTSMVLMLLYLVMLRNATDDTMMEVAVKTMLNLIFGLLILFHRGLFTK